MEVHRKDGDIENRPVSKGGKLFDLLTYGGIAGVGTFLATIPIANRFKPGGAFHGVDQWLRKSFSKVGVSEKLADEATTVTHLMWGGNVMLIPVGVMEHFRTPIVKAFNRFFNDPTDPKSIEDAPQQTAGSILKGRLMAWATVFVGFTATRHAIGDVRYEGLKHQMGTRWAKFRSQPIDAVNPNSAYNVGRTGAEDVLATISSATLLYVSSHFFAKRAYERKVTKDYLEQKRSGTLDAEATEQPTATAQAPASTETPRLQISHAQHEQALVAAPGQPQLSA